MKRIFIAASLILAMAVPAKAVEFFDTSAPESLCNFGLRVGFNTSNTSLNKHAFNYWNQNAWGLGFNTGAVVDINFRDYISLQPGFFFETRAGKYAYIQNWAPEGAPETLQTQVGSVNSCNFTIPIMCSVHFNMGENVRWNLELGPYVQILLKNTASKDFKFPVYTTIVPDPTEAVPNPGEMTQTTMVPVSASKVDFGVKFGTSFTYMKHYSLGVHYLAGCLNAWKPGTAGGRNKEWTFTVGYDF